MTDRCSSASSAFVYCLSSHTPCRCLSGDENAVSASADAPKILQFPQPRSCSCQIDQSAGHLHKRLCVDVCYNCCWISASPPQSLCLSFDPVSCHWHHTRAVHIYDFGVAFIRTGFVQHTKHYLIHLIVLRVPSRATAEGLTIPGVHSQRPSPPTHLCAPTAGAP